MRRRERAMREAGSDLADVAERVATVGAEEQRAEVRARPPGRRVPADHELLLLVHLDLQPARAPSLDVGSGRVLGHDAFEALLLRLLVGAEAVAREPARREERRGADDFLERRPPDGERLG